LHSSRAARFGDDAVRKLTQGCGDDWLLEGEETSAFILPLQAHCLRLRSGGMSVPTTSKGRSVFRRVLGRTFWDLNKRIWERLPARARDSHLFEAYWAWLHGLVRRRSHRQMRLGTFFVRNRPALDLMRRLTQQKVRGSTLRIAVLGCSIGVEVYSILWILRPARPDLKIVVRAVDRSPEVLNVAETGIYGPETSEMVDSLIFERLTPTEMRAMFDWEGDRVRVKSWLREGITWLVGDVCDPRLVTTLGLHDLVVANNFLCHMDAPSAERCLRNLAQLASPGGYAFVSGVDLDVRTNVALDLGWEPVSELRAEVHDGDPSLRAGWPWKWWGLEPLDRRRPDWETRYASVFRIGRPR
jgi:chemotaxis methyl-accepting protein methylase